MKKFVAAALGVAILSIPSFAVNKENTGCGLGYMIFKDAPDSTLFEILAVTTNGTFGNQTFGITTGTLECKQPQKVVKNDRLFKFVSENMDQLASDIASGNGETLDTVAELMNIPEDKKAEFYARLQENFDKIYPSEKVQSADVIDKIVEIAQTV
ncbi:Protein of unknown function [Persephonella hydrogeniphila]|uniref:DUF3015 domain-containing protein n=1 Tax=Persephonella hydrogeniphila TaxID=198703 RepID=A0A285NCU7_9AQUI|nr:DUF3015 family protein [Persephonella hydrogeniphila]SNZ07118.1 Protein of unknown function [Persephonella hydrogeniphila]